MNPLIADECGPQQGQAGLEPLLLRVTDVALVLGIGRTKVFALLAAGELPVVRLGRSVRIPREALERWVRERTDKGCSQALE
jgi:excisionase family DNA binding protein